MKFETIKDIKGNIKKYPVSKELSVLFCTKDLHFFIYALCTKKDYSTPELIELNSDFYFKFREDHPEYAELVIEHVAALLDFLSLLDYKTEYNVKTVGETLDLE